MTVFLPPFLMLQTGITRHSMTYLKVCIHMANRDPTVVSIPGCTSMGRTDPCQGCKKHERAMDELCFCSRLARAHFTGSLSPLPRTALETCSLQFTSTTISSSHSGSRCPTDRDTEILECGSSKRRLILGLWKHPLRFACRGRHIYYTHPPHHFWTPPRVFKRVARRSRAHRTTCTLPSTPYASSPQTMQ